MSTEYTMADLAKHTSVSSCWLCVRGIVYDVTRFLDDHPGALASLARSRCGDFLVSFSALWRRPFCIRVC